MISKKDGIVFDNGRLSEIFNAHFINITKNLDLKPSTLLYLIIKEGRGGGGGGGVKLHIEYERMS